MRCSPELGVVIILRSIYSSLPIYVVLRTPSDKQYIRRTEDKVGKFSLLAYVTRHCKHCKYQDLEGGAVVLA